MSFKTVIKGQFCSSDYIRRASGEESDPNNLYTIHAERRGEKKRKCYQHIVWANAVSAGGNVLKPGFRTSILLDSSLESRTINSGGQEIWEGLSQRLWWRRAGWEILTQNLCGYATRSRCLTACCTRTRWCLQRWSSWKMPISSNNQRRRQCLSLDLSSSRLTANFVFLRKPIPPRLTTFSAPPPPPTHTVAAAAITSKKLKAATIIYLFVFLKPITDYQDRTEIEIINYISELAYYLLRRKNLLYMW